MAMCLTEMLKKKKTRMPWMLYGTSEAEEMPRYASNQNIGDNIAQVCQLETVTTQLDANNKVFFAEIHISSVCRF